MTVAIAGIGELPQGRYDGGSPMRLHADLVQLALDDAGLELADIDALLTVSPRADAYLVHAAALAEHLGIRPNVVLTLEAGGAAPMAMIEVAHGLIATGAARNVLLVAADLPNGDLSSNAYVKTLAEAGPLHQDWERPFGPSVPSLFGLVARAHMAELGTRPEHLAAVALQNRRSAQAHPNAHQRKPMSIDDYEASPMVADPLRRFDCAPVSDGGAAIVVTSMDRAADGAARPVKVLSTGFATSQMHLSAADSLTGFHSAPALNRALERADLSREAIDLALIYDCFTIAMLVNLEDLGFAEKGEAGPAFAAGAFAQSSRLPVNPHGGLLSHGHPARAGGIGNVVEAVVQLRGEAGERQLPSVEVAMAHGMGGVFATHGVVLLGQP